jgi:hypothetical protein
MVQPLAITIIEESSQRTPAQAAILYDAAIADLIAARGHLCRIVDQHALFPKGMPPIIQDAFRRAFPTLPGITPPPLPYMVFWGTKTSTAVWEGPMPEIPADFQRILKTHGGP